MRRLSKPLLLVWVGLIVLSAIACGCGDKASPGSSGGNPSAANQQPTQQEIERMRRDRMPPGRSR